MWLQDASAIWDKDVSLMATEILSDCSKEEVECLAFVVKLKLDPQGHVHVNLFASG